MRKIFFVVGRPEHPAHAEKVGHTHQGVGEHLGVTLANLALAHRATQPRDVAGGEPVVVPTEGRLVDVLGLRHDAIELAVAAHEREKGPQALALGVEPALHVARRLAEIAAQAATQLVDQLDEGRLFVGKIDIKRAERHARAARDLGDRRALEAAIAEDLFGRTQNTLARSLPPGRHRQGSGRR